MECENKFSGHIHYDSKDLRRCKMTFLELVYETLKKHQSPLSIKEIWDKSDEYGYRKNLSTSGKTPIKTLEARLYLDIRDNPNSPFYQHSKRPSTFYIKDQEINNDSKEITSTQSKTAYNERDLHPLLTSFVYSDSHFECVTKTIHHEKSKKKRKGETEWLHPDIVGLYFPYLNYCSRTMDLINSFNDCQYKLFSFEMKIKVNFSNLREYYFQAVSNSSWANEGYLVAIDYEDDSELQEEMLRLNNAFGIGFIKLTPDNIEQSEILFPARASEQLDWNTINRLCEMNPEYKKFIESIVSDMRGSKVHLEEYDKVLSGDEIADYVKNKKIK